MNRVLFLLITLLGFYNLIWAQDDPEYRMELGAGVGLVNYEGDFNGKLFSSMQPMFSVVGRYVMNPYSNFRLSVGYGKLKGSSENVSTFYPDFSNNVSQKVDYNFSSSLVDVSLIYEYNFWPYGTGRDYRGARRLTPYILIGLGTTYAKYGKDIEGKSGSAFTANVPLGIGLKYKVAERLNLGLEWAMHFSLSDRLDGVKDPYGINSSGLFKNTDCYSSLLLTITYSFMPKCTTCNKE